VDKDTADAFHARLDQYTPSFNGGNGGRRSISSGDHTVCVVWPVKDVPAFASGLTFATVTAVSGRSIDVSVPPVAAVKESPFKKKRIGPDLNGRR